MALRPRAGARRRRGGPAVETYLLIAAGAVGVVLLAAAVVLALAHRAPTTHARRGALDTPSPAAPTVPTAQPACAAGYAACQAPNGAWIPLRSQSAADVRAAAAASPLFALHRSQAAAGQGDDLSRLGTPVLVRALQPPTSPSGGARLPDFYVLPVLDAAGNATAAAELELDDAHAAVHVIAIVTYAQPRPRGIVPALSAQAAAQAASAQARVALAAGSQPTLVYFPGDAAAQETGASTWAGGGEFPADPIWLVHGADGQDRVVGTDGKVYAPSQLPMLAG